jgi:hypothetical protein
MWMATLFGDCELTCILVLAELVGRLQFHKRCQYFIGVYNETLSIVAMGVNDPNRSSFGIDS